MNLQKLYDEAKAHKDSHKSCGGEPYKSYNELIEILKNFSANKESINILEIGTAVGFTTFILQTSTPRPCGGVVDTIEFHKEHIALAKENIQKWGGDITKINFLAGDARDVLPTLKENFYDLIFFDGYGVKKSFYEEFERILKLGGVVIVANKFLKSTEQEVFELFNNSKKWDFISEFSDTVIYKKI